MIDDIAEELLQIERERNEIERERNATLNGIKTILINIHGGMR